jgi:hypothetical protein
MPTKEFWRLTGKLDLIEKLDAWSNYFTGFISGEINSD